MWRQVDSKQSGLFPLRDATGSVTSLEQKQQGVSGDVDTSEPDMLTSVFATQ